MKELKILGIVVAFTLVLYIGIEPFAHKYLHPAVAPADFTFSDLEKVSQNGDAEKGKEFYEMSCMACHSLKADGFEPTSTDIELSEAYGVATPDLSSAAYIYDHNFLADLIKNPAHAVNLEHKFSDDTVPFPMTPYYGMGEKELDEEVADIIAYLKSVAPKEMNNKDVFVDACIRCHDMKYAGLYSTSEPVSLKNYMGMTPPDLSMMIKSRSGTYLETFLNDPQKNLPGTSMPRVGLKKETQEQVIKYMDEVGDSKKEERQTVGIIMMAFFALLAVAAYFWKKAVWRDLH